MGLTNIVAKFVAEKGYKDFSKEDIQAAKELVLDGIGTMISGAREQVAQITIQFVKDSGGVAECGVVGEKFKTSLINAVFANGVSIHANELESVGLYTGSNPMNNIPIALSLAEKCELSGKAVIEGVILGLEVSSKLGKGGPGAWDRGFSSIPLYGTLGAVASAGRLMNLSIEQLQHAFGIGIAQCSGQQRQQGSMTHYLESGLACRNGVTAAMLAKAGMTADANLIEGERGFYDLFSAGRDYSVDKVVQSLGNPFCVAEGYIKKYGNALRAHRAMDALVRLMEEHAIHYEDVVNVRAEVPPFAQLLRFRDPRDGEEAKFSLEQALGAILIDEDPELPYLRPFTDAGVADPKYKEARKKITVIERKDLTGGRSAPFALPVTVVLKSGQEYSKVVDANSLKGGRGNPLTWDELVVRHRALCKEFLSSRQIERSVELIKSLENLDSVSELMNLITFAKSL